MGRAVYSQYIYLYIYIYSQYIYSYIYIYIFTIYLFIVPAMMMDDD